MEQNLPNIAKKIWKIVRVVYFMLRKEISKGKLLAGLNIKMKRGKLAGKAAIKNLMFHHTAASRRFHDETFTFHRSLSQHSETAAQLTQEELMRAASSPVLPGFGPSPIVRQLRVTDSPFPARDGEEDNHVDEAAEEFIKNFYRDLRQENSRASLGYNY